MQMYEKYPYSRGVHMAKLSHLLLFDGKCGCYGHIIGHF